MKHYLLFVGATRYPNGGWKDLKDSYDSLVEPMKQGEKLIIEPTPPCQYSLYDWWHVVDLEEGGRVIAWDSKENTETPH